jgi:polysaccharide biosynthesis protein PslJ
MVAYAASRRAPAAASATLASAAVIALTTSALANSFSLLALGVALLAAAPLALLRTVPWHVLLGALVVVIVFIPIRRYHFATGLPIQLEPYRVLVALLLFGWFACLLVDDRIRLRRTGFEAPILLIGVAALGSIFANAGRAAAVEPEVIKSLSFLASFLLVFYLVTSVTAAAGRVEPVLKTLVSGMAVVGVLAVIESRTGTSPFGHIDKLFPVLEESDQGAIRAAGTRARGPAEHPIALGAALVLTVPIAFYFAVTSKAHRPLWWGSLGVLAFGALATLSRTGVVMLVVVVAVYLWLRPRQTMRLWPLLLPFLAVVHFAVPGTLGTLKYAFFPEGGVIAEQAYDVGGDCDAAGRIADLGPTLAEVARQPLFGIGFGTRIVVGENANACILDNQWLGTLLETGAAGAFAWVWLFTRLLRRLGQAAGRRERGSELSVALAASIAAYAVGMATYDALGFIQVTFLLFLLMGLAASVLMRTASGDSYLGNARTSPPF